MCWIYRVVDNTVNEIPFIIGDSNSYNQYIGFYISAAALPRLQAQLNPGSSFVDGTGTLALTTWYHIALVFNDTADTCVVYVNGVLNINQPLAGTAVWGLERIGNGASAAANWLSGRVAAWKEWTAVLTVEEIRTEMRCYMPVRVANLHSWHPFLTHTDLAQYGAAWTATGTLTTEQGPPIAWRVSPMQHIFNASAVVVATKAPPPRPRPWRTWRRAA